MNIKVCDAIMGSGKSSAAITLMNENPDRHYIYITPYLKEAARIKEKCPDLDFVEPISVKRKINKREHTLELLKRGKNIATTHTMFLKYTPDMLEYIRKYNYTLIIDEVVEVFTKMTLDPGTYQLIKEAGYISATEDGMEHVDSSRYIGRNPELVDFFQTAKSNEVAKVYGTDKYTYYYWLFTKDIFEAFSDIYILTYLFDSQIMKYYFDIKHIDFKYINISHPDEKTYRFSEDKHYIPEYTAHLSEMIHIFDNKKINSIGDDKYALSSGWIKKATYSRNKDRINALANNIYNYFRHYVNDIPASERMWSTFNEGKSLLRRKGYYRSDLAFNERATNDYKKKRALAYCVNIFMNPNEKNYFSTRGIDVKEDEYAVSVMIQWIWRSAIRDGKEIYIYLPSSRMRRLLTDWIKETENNYKELKDKER